MTSVRTPNDSRGRMTMTVVIEITHRIISIYDMNTSQILLANWIEGRTRFTNLLKEITAEDLKKRLPDTKNSAGFLIRHTADVEFTFVKNFFGAQTVETPKTLADQRDTGEWTDLAALLNYQARAFDLLKETIMQQTDDDWSSSIATPLFGVKTKAELLGRIASHTAYHAGQLALTLKYGR